MVRSLKPLAGTSLARICAAALLMLPAPPLPAAAAPPSGLAPP